ncbi:hypothetical protein Tco_0731982, partial [Tanacetum coccineum]
MSEDILGATTRRGTGSYYPKRYWELLPKEILGAITQRDTGMSDSTGATTQRDTGSYYPKRYWELLPKEILGVVVVGMLRTSVCLEKRILAEVESRASVIPLEVPLDETEASPMDDRRSKKKEIEERSVYYCLLAEVESRASFLPLEVPLDETEASPM